MCRKVDREETLGKEATDHLLLNLFLVMTLAGSVFVLNSDLGNESSIRPSSMLSAEYSKVQSTHLEMVSL